MTERLLEQVPLFASLPADELRRLGAIVRQQVLAPGTLVVREGEPGDRFYFVHSGELEIVKALGTPDERVLMVEGEGTFVGEMSLLSPDGRRTASVRARTVTQVSEMMHADLEALLRRHPALAYDIARVLSTRLHRVNNAIIHDLHEKNRELHEKNEALAAAYTELQAAQAQLVDKEALERELQVARKIQISMLPRTLPRVAGYGFGARILPAHAVGGDFFDFIDLRDGRLGIVIGDVSGKGVPAALFMALTRSLVRSEAFRTETPYETLRSVNRHLLGMNDADMFVTLLYGVLHAPTGEFKYARAGHELPLVIADAGGIVTPTLGLGQPLGVFPHVALDEQSICLAPGSVLLLYTDGVTETRNDAGRFFDLAGLEEALRAHHGLRAPDLCDRLVQILGTYRGAAPQADDITLLAVRRALP